MINLTILVNRWGGGVREANRFFNQWRNGLCIQNYLSKKGGRLKGYLLYIYIYTYIHINIHRRHIHIYVYIIKHNVYSVDRSSSIYILYDLHNNLVQSMGIYTIYIYMCVYILFLCLIVRWSLALMGFARRWCDVEVPYTGTTRATTSPRYSR
jgi:hypothetical protein